MQLLEPDVLTANCENIVKEYHTKIMGWKDFDETIFASFESFKIPPAGLYPFKRQKATNTNLGDEDITISLNDIPPPPEDKTKIEPNFGITDAAPLSGPFDFPPKSAGEEEEGVYLVKFPHYAKMCPFPHDKVGKVPIIQAISMLQWLERNFFNGRSSTDYLKEALNKDNAALDKLEDTIPLMHAMCEDLVEKLCPLLYDVEDMSVSTKIKEWAMNNRKTLKDHILKVQEQLIQELLVNEKTGHKDANILSLYLSQPFQKAVLAFSAELVSFIHNCQIITIPHIHRCLNASYLETWKLIPIALNLLSSMPGPLRQHFRELELAIVKSKAFIEESEFALHIQNLTSLSPNILQVFFCDKFEPKK